MAYALTNPCGYYVSWYTEESRNTICTSHTTLVLHPFLEGESYTELEPYFWTVTREMKWTGRSWCGNSREGLSLWQGTHISTEGNDNTPTDTWVSKGATKREEFMGKKGAGGHLTNLYIWKIKVQSFLNSLNTLGIIFKFYFIFLPPPSHPAAFRQTFVYLLGRCRKTQRVLCAAICAILGASKASTSHDKETQG